MASDHTHVSKFLSYILRHHPEEIGLEVDSRGWAHLPTLIKKAKNNGRAVHKDQILEIMKASTKKRFSLSDDGQYIRAGYGHSMDVDLGLAPQSPPNILYHGTAKKNLSSILESGLHPQNRNRVHLSDNQQDALSVGSRHGKPIILKINAQKMYEAGFPFYQSESEPGIWLVKNVPRRFITT